ncbi:MAG: hypothetical protein WA060_02825 [Minisyncoccia bacterium]
MHSNIFDRLSFLSLFLVVVLLPVFCLPFTNIPVETSKGLLLVLGLVACIIFWAIARFSDGEMIFPKSSVLLAGFGVVLAVLFSAIFSGNSQVSLFGVMFDIGSFWFIFSGFILMLLSSIVFRTKERAKVVLLGVILSSAFVLIFQTAHLFMPNILSLGILSGKTGNVLGSWNALGLFAGFSSLVFLLVVEFFPISRMRKFLLEIFMLLSILLAATVNFPLVWVLLGISSLIIFVYKTSISFQGNEEGNTKRHFPIISFTVVMVSLLFFVSGQFIGNIIPNRLQITNSEVSPSLGATMSIAKGVLLKDPVWGVGPNRFDIAWAMHKPGSINDTQFWDVSFTSGSGLIPTFLATTGGLGILAWLLFFVLFLITGMKSVFSSIKDGANWEVLAFFVLSLYLFISSFFYSTGTVIFLLALAFAGVFIGLVSSGGGKEFQISFLNDHRKSFFSILALIIVVIFSATISFKYIERVASVSYFGKSLQATSVAEAENAIGKALSLYSNDLYLRTYSQIYLVKLDSIVSAGESLSEEDKANLKISFDQAVNSAQLATTYDPQNYVNFQLLGSVYQGVGTLGVKDAYSNAVLAYQTASSLNPLNPGLKLAMASASLADGKTKEAKDYAKAALSLKQNYIDALILLSQISKKEGNNAEALSYGKVALSLAPNDKNLIQYVNSLSGSPTPPSSEDKTD